MKNTQNVFNNEEISVEKISQERDNEILKNYLNKNGYPNGVKLKYTEKFYYKDYLYLKNRYSDSESFAETVYRIKNNIEEKPTCPICGKPISYCGKFKKHCSTKCSANDPNTREQCKNTCQKKYGVDNVYQSKKIIDKIKNSNIEKYGVPSYVQTEEYRERVTNTNLKKYGTKFVSQSEEVKNKIKSTVREKYGVENISQIPEVKEKKKTSSLKKYGTICTFQGKETAEKIKETNLKKYGCENPSSSPIIRERVKETCLKRYGVDSYLKTQEIKEKSKITSLEKYGTEYPSQSAEVKNKIIKTMKEHHSFGTSKPEEIVFNLLKEKFKNVDRQHKTEEYPFLADFYIYDINLYIEYQESWTHGNHPFDKNNPDDLEKLKDWNNKSKKSSNNFYISAIHTWTIRDPLKRQTAKDNNLNWKEFWNIQEVEDWLNILNIIEKEEI